ncbi:MAG: glutamate--tRNA ligase [Phycisphaerales bacterium]|jgi:glutamyl-tRNA synthetase|nr:glutamate--tRNA ligase [Phycisphaerales bacterium]
MSADQVVTRFAPSPTGYLHVGGARTALFNWLLARHSGGRFLLRIEDTDLNRSTEQAVHQLLDDLRWLGLHWDNAELVYQSKRTDVYNQLIAQLIERGQAYKAYESAGELDALRKAAEREKRNFVYQRPRLTDEQLRQYEAEGRPHVVRFATQAKEYQFHDVVLDKPITIQPDQVQDFVIRKADGMPTYHFAVVVDDAQMGVTHILRGQEHLLNTVNHIAIQEALGYPRPTYGHLPIILNPDGSKMGKRDRDKKIRHHANIWLKNHQQEMAKLAGESQLSEDRLRQWIGDAQKQLDLAEQSAVMKVIGLRESDLPEILVHDFRSNGYLPQTLLNFLALLGWSPGGDKERLDIAQMVDLFSIGGIGKSNSKFDRDKLLAFNTEACAAVPVDRLVKGMRDYLSVNPDSPLNGATDQQLGRLFEMKKGIHTLREIDDLTGFFFVADDQIQFDPAAVEKVLRKQDGLASLREMIPILQGVADWSAASLESMVKLWCEQKQLGLGKVAQPIRIAISGTTVSPPIFESLEFLGRERTLRRIERCLQLLG